MRRALSGTLIESDSRYETVIGYEQKMKRITYICLRNDEKEGMYAERK